MKRILDFIRRTFGVNVENVLPSQNDTEKAQTQEVAEDWREKLLREHTERVAELRKKWEGLMEQRPHNFDELREIGDRISLEYYDYSMRKTFGYDCGLYSHAKVE